MRLLLWLDLLLSWANWHLTGAHRHLTGTHRHLHPGLLCRRWRRVRHIDNLYVEDQAFKRLVTGAGLLIVGHKTRDV